MNYLQMYINLGLIFTFLTVFAWIAATFPYEDSRTRKPVVIVALIFTVVLIFCAAMAGLLS